MYRRFLVMFIGLLVLTGSVWGDVYRVPDPYPDIQTALDSCGMSDTILIAPGTYSGPGFWDLEVLDSLGLTIAGEKGADSTVIDLDRHRFLAVLFHFGAWYGWTNIEGLELRGGSEGVYVEWYTNCSIRNCIFRDNYVGIMDSLHLGLELVDSCLFLYNDCGIHTRDEGGTVRHCFFGMNGYALELHYSLGSHFIENVFFHNYIAMNLYLSSTPRVHGNIFFRNGIAFMGELGYWASFQNNNVYASYGDDFEHFPNIIGDSGNVSVDPWFCDTSVVPFWEVRSFSPMLAENNSSGVNIGRVEAGCLCCMDGRGNVDLEPNCNWDDSMVDVADLTNLIDHLFLSYDPLCCRQEADIAPLDSPDGSVDVADLTALVDHLFISYPDLPECE